jgi:hypothetical protein
MLIINFVQNGLGYILGDFFANTSGHPAFESGLGVSALGCQSGSTLQPSVVLVPFSIQVQIVHNVSSRLGLRLRLLPRLPGPGLRQPQRGLRQDGQDELEYEESIL